MRMLLDWRKRRGARAFTLIELMVAIAVLVILAAIAVPNFAAYRDNAIKAKCLANMVLVRQAYMGMLAVLPATGSNASNMPGNLWQYSFFGANTMKTPQCPLGGAYNVSWINFTVSGTVAQGGFQVSCSIATHTSAAE